jgi:hypothetical protein
MHRWRLCESNDALKCRFWFRPGASAGSRRCLIGAAPTGLGILRQGPVLLAKAGFRRVSRYAYEQRLTGRVQLAVINVEGGEGAAAYEWQFEIDTECKDEVGACSIQALARPLVSGSGPGQAFQRQFGARLALNRRRRNDQGEGFGRLARGSSRGGRGACS